MLNRTQALIFTALIAMIFGSGWVVNGWRLEGRHAQGLAQRDKDALAMAEAVKQIGISANETIATADAKGVKEIKYAEDQVDRWRKCVADGSCSVRLKSSAAQQPGASADAASSMGNAASGITGEAAGRVLDLWKAVDTDAAKLGYLQTYSSTCWKALNTAAKLKAN